MTVWYDVNHATHVLLACARSDLVFERHRRKLAQFGNAVPRFLVFPDGGVMDRRHDLAVDVRGALERSDLVLARGLVALYQRMLGASGHTPTRRRRRAPGR